MANFEIDFTVEKNALFRRLNRKLDDAVESAAKELARDTVETGVGHLSRKGAVYSGDLISSFAWETNKSLWGEQLRIVNTSEHAPFQDKGVRGVKGGVGKYQYRDKKPPLQSLIPWVQAKLSGWSVVDGKLVPPKIFTDGGRDLPPASYHLDFGDGTQVDPAIASMDDQSDDLSAGMALKGATWKLTFQNGGDAVFKDQNYARARVNVLNEALWASFADGLGWEITPETKLMFFEHGGIDHSGTAMAFVPDSQNLDEHSWNYASPTEQFSELLSNQENVERLVRMGFIDFFMGNGDRHSGNILVDSNGLVHAIDNGGYLEPEVITYENLVPPGISEVFDHDQFPDLATYADKYLDEMERVLPTIQEKADLLYSHLEANYNIEDPYEAEYLKFGLYKLKPDEFARKYGSSEFGYGATINDLPDLIAKLRSDVDNLLFNLQYGEALDKHIDDLMADPDFDPASLPQVIKDFKNEHGFNV